MTGWSDEQNLNHHDHRLPALFHHMSRM
jgi:hypothetical protein